MLASQLRLGVNESHKNQTRDKQVSCRKRTNRPRGARGARPARICDYCRELILPAFESHRHPLFSFAQSGQGFAVRSCFVAVSFSWQGDRKISPITTFVCDRIRNLSHSQVVTSKYANRERNRNATRGTCLHAVADPSPSTGRAGLAVGPARQGDKGRGDQ